MTCAKCNCSVNDYPFVRMNEFGVDGIWWCEPCAKKHEPELYNNLKEDESEVEVFLKSISYQKKPQCKI